MKPEDIVRKLTEVLSPEFQRRYQKAIRDMECGRNLEQAVATIYAGTGMSKEEIARIVKVQEAEFARRREKGKKLVVEGLGKLTHDGEQFICKKKTLLYPKSAVVIGVDPELAHDESLGKLWAEYCRRERSLIRELESAISKYYRGIRQRPSSTDPLPSLKSNSDIWATLGKPEISFHRYRREVELELAWSPTWEDEHGLYVYLSRAAKIRHIGEFR